MLSYLIKQSIQLAKHQLQTRFTEHKVAKFPSKVQNKAHCLLISSKTQRSARLSLDNCDEKDRTNHSERTGRTEKRVVRTNTISQDENCTAVH